MLATVPNRNAGRKFGQGLPPVSVTLKKICENGRDSKVKFKKFSKTFHSISTPDTSTHALDIARQYCCPVRKRSEPPTKSYGPKNVKKRQRHQFWDQKSSFWSTKKVLIKKRQQELLLISSIGGRMQNLGRIVWFNSEIVIFVKVFYA